jgi:hypothetical protein
MRKTIRYADVLNCFFAAWENVTGPGVDVCDFDTVTDSEMSRNGFPDGGASVPRSCGYCHQAR